MVWHLKLEATSEWPNLLLESDLAFRQKLLHHYLD